MDIELPFYTQSIEKMQICELTFHCMAHFMSMKRFWIDRNENSVGIWPNINVLSASSCLFNSQNKIFSYIWYLYFEKIPISKAFFSKNLTFSFIFCSALFHIQLHKKEMCSDTLYAGILLSKLFFFLYFLPVFSSYAGGGGEGIFPSCSWEASTASDKRLKYFFLCRLCTCELGFLPTFQGKLCVLICHNSF